MSLNGIVYNRAALERDLVMLALVEAIDNETMEEEESDNE